MTGQEFLGAMLGVKKEEASVAVWDAEMAPGSVRHVEWDSETEPGSVRREICAFFENTYKTISVVPELYDRTEPAPHP